jgi:hypothetical protein
MANVKPERLADLPDWGNTAHPEYAAGGKGLGAVSTIFSKCAPTGQNLCKQHLSEQRAV